VKKHFSKELINLKSFKAGNFKNALIDNFLRMDEAMVEPTNKQELKVEAKKSKEDDDKQNKTHKNENSQMDYYNMVDPKYQEDVDISLHTGCTAVVCLINENTNKIYFANAGDSRVLICRKGVAYPMSLDHKPDLDVEKNRIYKADGWVSEGRVKGKKYIDFLGNLNLSRSLGDLEYKQNKKMKPEDQMITAFPDVVEETITNDTDFIVLACDGVWDCMTNQEVADFIYTRLRKTPNIKLSKIIEEMLDKCLASDLYSGIKLC
jgi:protein phosphatase 1G